MQLPEVPAYQLAFATLLCAVLTDGKWMQVAERQRLPSGNLTVFLVFLCKLTVFDCF